MLAPDDHPVRVPRAAGRRRSPTHLLEILGGKQVVHGHSVIADQLGILPAQVEAPYEYAGGRVLGVDGGLFVGGPCLIVPLPYTPED